MPPPAAGVGVAATSKLRTDLATSAKKQPMEHEDSNAVRCPGVADWFALDRKALHTKQGGRTVPCYAIHYILVYEAVCCVGLLWEDVHIKFFSSRTSRDVLIGVVVLIFVFGLVQLGLAVEQMRKVIREGGALDALGAGETMVSARAHWFLKSLRWKLRIAKLFNVFFTCMGAVGFVVMMGQDNGLFIGLCVGGMGLVLMSAGLILLDFGLALQVATVLSSDAVIVVANSVETISPTDIDQWEIKVVKPTLALEASHVRVLSQGFGPGLAIFYTTFGSLALASFIVGLVSSWFRVIMPATCALFLYLPMAMSNGVAQVSTSCDGAMSTIDSHNNSDATCSGLYTRVYVVVEALIIGACAPCSDLMQAINTRRIEDLQLSERLRSLELAMHQLNNGQGCDKPAFHAHFVLCDQQNFK
jgi:hypothetical protein